jgi:glycosyltransferase involved in cell wall biosynthesis
MNVATFEKPSDAMSAAFEEIGIHPQSLGDHGYLGPARRLRKFIDEQRIDIVVATSFKAYICAKYAARGRCEVVFWLHAIRGVIVGNVRRRIVRLLSKRDAMIFVSQAVRDAQLPPGHSGRTQVIHDGVEDFQVPDSAAEIRASLGLASDAKVIAYVAEFVECKDHPTAIAAVRELVGRGINAQLLLIGTGELMESARRAVEAAGLIDRVHFLGVRNDVRPLLAAADFYIHPGRDEGFGLAVVEAMLARRAVLAARSGAMPEIIEAGKTGMLFEPGDGRALADQIEMLSRETDWAAAMGEAARAECLDRFNPRRFAGEMARFLEGCLGREPAAAAAPAEIELCAS